MEAHNFKTIVAITPWEGRPGMDVSTVNSYLANGWSIFTTKKSVIPDDGGSYESITVYVGHSDPPTASTDIPELTEEDRKELDAELAGLAVRSFHYIDDRRCLSPLLHAVTTAKVGPAELAKEAYLLEKLADLFRAAGWEGDGDIECIAMAPCFLGIQDGWTRFAYHVKQSNNGTSWIAYPDEWVPSLPKN